MSNYDLLYIERRAIDSAAYYEREKGSAIYEEHTLAYGMGARWMEKELQAKVKWFDQILSGNSKKLVKENEELQAKVKRLEGRILNTISTLNDHMHPNHDGAKCWGCLSLEGYAHQSYCMAIHIVDLLEKELKGEE